MEDRPNYGQPWTDEEREQLERRFQEGLDLEALAAAHGRTCAAIAAELERQGLVFNLKGVLFTITRDEQGEIVQMDRYADQRQPSRRRKGGSQ